MRISPVVRLSKSLQETEIAPSEEGSTSTTLFLINASVIRDLRAFLFIPGHPGSFRLEKKTFLAAKVKVAEQKVFRKPTVEKIPSSNYGQDHLEFFDGLSIDEMNQGIEGCRMLAQPLPFIEGE